MASTTTENTNGQGEVDLDPTFTPTRGVGSTPGTTPPGDRKIPDTTKVDIDRAHREMIEDWFGWYYPALAPKDRPSIDVIVAEMIDLAHGIAAADNQRPETPTERLARLKGRPK